MLDLGFPVYYLLTVQGFASGIYSKHFALSLRSLLLPIISVHHWEQHNNFGRCTIKLCFAGISIREMVGWARRTGMLVREVRGAQQSLCVSGHRRAGRSALGSPGKTT